MPSRTIRVTRLAYRVNEVAELLAISRSAVYRGIKAGTIPVLRHGRSVRVPAWWLEEATGKRAA
jgi:excisionase family DNA binding protein